jgi:hypothetical protein
MEKKGLKRIKIKEEEARVKNKLLITTSSFDDCEPKMLQCLVEFQPNQPTEKERFLLDIIGTHSEFDPYYERGANAQNAMGTYFFTKYGKSKWTKEGYPAWALLEEFLEEHGGECEIMDESITNLIKKTKERYDWILDISTDYIEDDKDDILENVEDYIDYLKNLLEQNRPEIQRHFKNNPGLIEKILDLSVEDFKLD